MLGLVKSSVIDVESRLCCCGWWEWEDTALLNWRCAIECLIIGEQLVLANRLCLVTIITPFHTASPLLYQLGCCLGIGSRRRRRRQFRRYPCLLLLHRLTVPDARRCRGRRGVVELACDKRPTTIHCDIQICACGGDLIEQCSVAEQLLSGGALPGILQTTPSEPATNSNSFLTTTSICLSRSRP